jgi:DNA-binding transcriptional ArsR family regulator
MLKQSAALDLAFQALADPTRRAIVARLARGPASVSALAAGQPMSLPAVHQHLKVLEESGLISSEKIGRVRTCRIEAQAMGAAQDWLAQQRAEWEARFDRFDAVVMGQKNKDDDNG